MNIVGLLIIMAIATVLWGDAGRRPAMKVIGIFTVIVALGTYLICGGLSLAISMIFKVLIIGMIVPIIPVNLVCGLTLGIFAFAIAWLFPCVPVLVNELTQKK